MNWCTRLPSADYPPNFVILNTMQLPIKRLHPDAKVPTYAHHNDAGMDLCTVAAVTVAPGERVQIPTGIAVAIPDGYVGLVWDKSGLSHRVGLKTLGGVVDAGYRGEVFVGLVNTGATPHTFAVGEKVAQLLIQRVEQPEIVEVTDLDETLRGAAGFGSTGK